MANIYTGKQWLAFLGYCDVLHMIKTEYENGTRQHLKLQKTGSKGGAVKMTRKTWIQKVEYNTGWQD
jgi:hypothetical protein